MGKVLTSNKKVLIVTGYTPISAATLNAYGAGVGVHPYLSFPSFRKKENTSISVPTLGAVAIASYLQSNGIDVEVMDYYRDERHFENAYIVGISTTFMELDNVKEVVAHIESQNANAIIVLGGPLSWSILPKDLFNDLPGIDVIVQKEGEETFLDLVNSICSDSNLESVKGISYRKDGRIFHNPEREHINIDTVPMPDWKLTNINKRLKVLPVETARGCSYNCAFCNEVHYWGKPVRFKRVENIVKEIIAGVSEFGISTFRFVDSCFSAPEERCEQICDAIFEKCIKKGIEVKWSSYARVNNLTERLLRKMKQAGCVALDVGWESGDQSILRNMRKIYDPKKIKESIKVANSLGILLHCNTLIGFPGETMETIENTIMVLEDAKPDTYQCLYLYLSPNSYLYQNAEKFQITGERHNWEHYSMNSEQAEKAISIIYKRLPSLTMFAGGEFFSCYLTSLNFSVDEIRECFKAINRISRGTNSPQDILIVDKVDNALREYW